MGVFVFPPGGGGGSISPTNLLSADADSSVGSAVVADNGSSIEVTVPAEASGIKNQLSTVPDFKVWDTGITVGGLLGLEVGVRVTNLVVPSGTNAEVILIFGLAFASAAAFDRTATDAVIGWIRIGNNGGNNTTHNVGTTRDNLTCGTGSNIGTVDSSQLRFRLRRDARRSTWFLETLDTSPGTDDERIGQFTDTLTETDSVYVFVGIGRTDVNATTPQISFQLDYLPPGADWSET